MCLLLLFCCCVDVFVITVYCCVDVFVIIVLLLCRCVCYYCFVVV